MAVVASVAVNLDSRGVPAKLKQIADRGKEVDRSLNGAAAATTKVGREMKTAANGMQYYIDAAGKARKANGQFVSTAEAAAAGLQKQNRGFEDLVKGALKLAAAYATLDQAGRLATSSIQAAARAASSDQRIRALSDGFDNYADVLEVAARAAEKFNLSTIQSQDAVAQLYGRLRPLGLTLDEVETVFSGFSTAAALTGATAAESAGALLQLSQALGAGALRGEEFNSIAEQAPAVLQAIAREVGKPVGQLKQLAREGKLTSDVVISALQRVEREGADTLAAALDTPAQKFVTLQNRVEDLQVALGNLLLPETIALLEGLAGAATNAATEVDKLALAKAGLKRALDDNKDILERILVDYFKLEILLPGIKGAADIAAQGMDTMRDAILRNIPGLTQIILLLEAFERLRGGIGNLAINEQAAQSLENRGGMESGGIPVWDGEKYVYDDPPKVDPLRKRLGLPDLETDRKGRGRSRGRGSSGPSPEEVLARQTEFGEQLLKQKQRELALTIEQDPLMRELLQISYERADAEERVKDAAAGQRDELLKTIKQVGELKTAFVFGKSLAESLIGTSEQLDRVRSGFLEGAKIDEQLQKANQEADIFKQTMQGVGDIIGNQLRGAIDGLISGTADWNNILRDTLSQLGSLFLNAGLNQLAGPAGSGGILSFLGFGARANGGPVNANQPYIVGERGPELFMPSISGSITSNENLQAQNRAFLDSIYTENGEPASDDSETEREATAATQAAVRGSEFEATAATRDAIRENERIQENRMQIMSQQKEFDRRYERERIEQMASTPGKLNIKYESQVINGVEYVTAEQHRKGMAQAADRGRALTLQTLQNSVKTRSRVGI